MPPEHPRRQSCSIAPRPLRSRIDRSADRPFLRRPAEEAVRQERSCRMKRELRFGVSKRSVTGSSHHMHLVASLGESTCYLQHMDRSPGRSGKSFGRWPRRAVSNVSQGTEEQKERPGADPSEKGHIEPKKCSSQCERRVGPTPHVRPLRARFARASGWADLLPSDGAATGYAPRAEG